MKNKYDPNKHHRRSIRLKGYDYSQAGLYFITICVQHRACLFGHIKNGEMVMNDAGKMVEKEWLELPQRFPNIQLDEHVVMPNHFHAILEIVGAALLAVQNDVGKGQENEKGQPQGIAPTGIAPTTIAPTEKPKRLGDMVGAFNSITTVEYIRGVKNNCWQPFNRKLWQRNYWEHIIRNEQSYQNISAYILNNPLHWQGDKFHNK